MLPIRTLGCYGVSRAVAGAASRRVPRADLDTATSSVTFFRSVGGSVGVSIFGALFNSRLADNLARSLPSGTSLPTNVRGSIDAIRALPAAAQRAVETAYADS